MERSQSAPGPIRLANEDYAVPKHGLGLTGPAKKVQLGTFSKDKGEFSSRIALIQKQGAKTPGPGKYIGHTQWVTPDKTKGTRTTYDTVTRFGYQFEKGSRDHPPLNKVPAPSHYERKDIGTSSHSIASRECLSNKGRVRLGRCSKGPKRSFLDNIKELSKDIPAPGQYHSTTCVPRNHLEIHTCGPSFEIKHTESRKPPVKVDVAPNHYKPSFALCEELRPNYTVPKDQGNNFVDKAVKGKMVDSKTQMPAPGKHDMINLSKVSRGTKQLCLGGLGRGACSGYF